MNDAEFVQGLREQEPAALRHLTECYLPSVWRFVYVRVDRDSHLAEDIVSESVLALIRAVASDSDIRSPLAWLRSVANHKVQDHFRAVARVQHLIEDARESGANVDDRDAVKQHELQERRRLIREVVEELPEKHRLALEWKYVERLSVREIATRLSTTEKATESILFRARREFREKLVCRDRAEEHRSAPPRQEPGKSAVTNRAEAEAARKD